MNAGYESRRAFAEIIGISVQNLLNIELCKFKRVNQKNMIKLCNFFNINYSKYVNKD
jgi:DNA-binding Xre family transcriptional regulator